MKRRDWLLGGVGASAAIIGAGWAWHRQTQPLTLLDDSDTRPSSEVPDGLWTASFAKPDGGELQMADFRGKPLLINFWATWCPPCVKEMPDLERFHQRFSAQGGRVLGLAIDGAAPVREFLQKVQVHFPIALGGLLGTDLGRALGNSQGGLPFSVVISRAGKPLWRKLGASHYDELNEKAQDWLR
jgi:thiol-disulfide isomerase/thioredoxin